MKKSSNAVLKLDSERERRYTTVSDMDVEPLYGPPHTADLDYDRQLNDPGQYPFTARRLSFDVPRQAVDDAPVRGLRRSRGHQSAFSIPARAGPDGPLHRLRHAHPDGLRRRPPARPRGSRSRGGVGKLVGRYGSSLCRDSARSGYDLDDRQLLGQHHPRHVFCPRRTPRHSPGKARWNDPERHAQGVHRTEGMDQPAASVGASHRRHDRVLFRARAALAPRVDLRLPHPRSRLDGGTGAGIHPRRWNRLRTGSDRPRFGCRRVRAAPFLLLQRPQRFPRGDRQNSAPPAACGRGSCASDLVP